MAQMNIDEYEKQFETTYAAFAEAVKCELHNAFKAADGNINQPQAITARAKAASSLRSKLEKRGLLTSCEIEKEIKDLAGVRIIFYTNNAANHFRRRSFDLIFRNFDVKWEEMKVHYPNPENDGNPYEAFHYIIRFTSEMLIRPEYSLFQDLRCEIQIQTMLSHVWAEVSHDILYKKSEMKDFGSEAFQKIEKRMLKIPEEYLRPAGHEFDKVLDDFERLMKGKALYDRDMLETLLNSSDNNERYDTLTTIKEYVVPNYDDIEKIYPELARALCDAVKVARQTAPKPIPVNFESLPGYSAGRTAEDITKLAAGIFAQLCYVDVDITFHGLTEIFRDEPDDEVQKHILEAVKLLAKHDLDVWEKIGPYVQFRLTELVEQLSVADHVALKPIVCIVWREALSTAVEGMSRKTEMTFTKKISAAWVSNELKLARRKAIEGLIKLLDQVKSLAEKKEIVSDLMTAMSMPPRGHRSTALYAMMIADTECITNLLMERIDEQPYELRQDIEYEMLTLYQRAKGIADSSIFDCKNEAESLCRAIKALRDRINTDTRYVRYKTLVGLRSVVPPQWENDSFDSKTAEDYRRKESSEYITAISEENADEWYELIIRCAETEPDCSETFWIFSDFLRDLAKDKPGIVLAWLKAANEHLLSFLPSILNGLSDRSAAEDYESLITRYVEEGKHLTEIAKHLRYLKLPSVDQAKTLLDKALTNDDNKSVIHEIVALAVEKHESAPGWIEAIFVPALKYFIDAKDHRWINKICYLQNLEAFVANLSSEQIFLVLKGLLPAPEIDSGSGIERFLALIAARDLAAILTFFGQRLANGQEIKDYKAVPFSFYWLEVKESLSTNIDLVIDTVRSGYRPDDHLFRYRGGRLLDAALPKFTDVVCTKFKNLAETGSYQDLDFILDSMFNYRGDAAIFPVLMTVVNRLLADDDRLKKVECCIMGTDVVSGPFGFTRAYQDKKRALQPWCNDSRPSVKDFVSQFIRQLDSYTIPSEQHLAERELARRRLDFDPNTGPQ